MPLDNVEPLDNLTDQPQYMAQESYAPERSTLGRIGLALEAFGAGYEGRDPLALKLRRQRMLEQQHTLDTQMKLQQMKVTQVEHSNTMFFKSAEMLKDNPKAMKQLTEAEALKGVPAAVLFKRVGVTNKDIDLLTSPDSMTELAVLSPSFHAKVMDALKGGSADTVDPNEAHYWIKAVTERREKKLQARQESDEYTMLKKQLEAGTIEPDSSAAERFNELHTKRMKMRADLEKARIEIKALGSSDVGTAESAAGLNTPAAIGAQSEARQKATFAYQGGTEMQNGLAFAMFKKPFAQLEPKQAEQVLARQLEWDKQVAATKAAGGLEVPEEVGKRTNIISVKALRSDNAIVHPPAGITKAQMRKGDYVEVSDKQLEGWNKLHIAKGQAKLAFDTMRPHITAKDAKGIPTQVLHLFKSGYLNSDSPEIRSYNSMKDALASVMARFVEVGVLTNTDVTRWSGALPGWTETKGSFSAKEEVFNKLYGIASEVIKDSLLGTDPATVQQRYSGKLGELLHKAEKASTPEQLQADFETLTRGK